MKLAAAALAVLLSAPFVVRAGEPITVGETLTLTSKILGEERTLLVSTPAAYARNSTRYGVLYMTDGDAHLTHTRGTVDFLAQNGLIPNLIIVGITNTDRTRDLSPTPVKERPNSGGGPRFLDFFEKELFPFIDAKYRTTPFRVFAGHSLGGLLALQAFTERPELFNAVISASPYLPWDDDYPLRRAEAFLKERKECPKTLFLSMATEEARDPKPTRSERLATLVTGAKVPGLAFEYLHLGDEDHGSVVLRTHYAALRRIFDGWRVPIGPDGAPQLRTPQELKAHYGQLSKRMGYPVQPPEVAVNQLGYWILGQGDREGALVLFRENVALYPESANVYDSLGEALEQAGRTEEALAQYTLAAQKAQKLGDPRAALFAQNRDRLAKAQQAPK